MSIAEEIRGTRLGDEELTGSYPLVFDPENRRPVYKAFAETYVRENSLRTAFDEMTWDGLISEHLMFAFSSEDEDTQRAELMAAAAAIYGAVIDLDNKRAARGRL